MFTKSDLKDGDIATFKNGDKRIKAGHKFSNKTSYLLEDDFTENLTIKSGMKQYDIIKVERPVQYETVYERKEEILDKAEKRYLRNVIGPFRKEVVSITKMQKYETQFIRIKKLNSFNSNGYLPSFKSETKYKKMETGKEYTLEELWTIKE